MSRPRHFDLRRRTSRCSRHALTPHLRLLRSEPLEDRRMLAAVTVNNDLDVVNGNTSSIANLIASDGGDGIALREAIEAANNTLGADTVTFDASLDGGTIFLALDELPITEAATIDATSLANGLTIDAQEISRIANIFTSAGDFTFAGLTLTGGRETGFNQVGGAIRSTTSGLLTIDQSTISGNSATGEHADGGGISARGSVLLTHSNVNNNSSAHSGGGVHSRGDVELIDSNVSGNSAVDNGGGINADDVTLTNSMVSGNNSSEEGGGISAEAVTLINSSVSGNIAADNGGGISADTVTLTDSSVDDNTTLEVAGLGGGIFAANVTLTRSTMTGNRTIERASAGGGIFSTDSVTLISSSVSGNSTLGGVAYGGGISGTENVHLFDSAVNDNSTMGGGAVGGGIFVRGSVTLTNSTVSGNSTSGDLADGGGIHSSPFTMGAVTLTNSTVSGNTASGIAADGGGIYAKTVTLTNSTVSGNSISGDSAKGGGIHAQRDVTLTYSTIADNHASFSNSTGGGIWNNLSPVVITGSIVASNTAGGSNPDLKLGAGTLVVDYSLFGDTSDLTAGQLADVNGGVGNVLNVVPMLDVLANNGGPTETHALLVGSPAIDAADPAFMPPPLLDQRGYYRLIDGDGDMTARVDMGATEYDSIPPLPGDGNLDGLVDGLDYIIWATNYGDDPAQDPPGSPQNGDYNNDGLVDGIDYVLWATNYGTGVPAVPAAQTLGSASATPSKKELKAVDLALEDDYDTGATVADDTSVRDWQLSRAFDAAIERDTGSRRAEKHLAVVTR